MSRGSTHKKLKLVPISQDGGAVPKRNFRGSPFIRNTPEYDIILKLGRIKGYDDNRRVLGSDGKYVQGSDITMLLCEAMTPKRVLNGMDEFIKLLDKAKVDPDLIVNDNVKSKFVAYKRRNNSNNDDAEEEESDSLSVLRDEIIRPTDTNRANIRRQQPVVALRRINISDYNHLLGRGKSTSHPSKHLRTATKTKNTRHSNKAKRK